MQMEDVQWYEKDELIAAVRIYDADEHADQPASVAELQVSEAACLRQQSLRRVASQYSSACMLPFALACHSLEGKPCVQHKAGTSNNLQSQDKLVFDEGRGAHGHHANHVER